METTTNPTCSTVELTNELAMQIYNGIVENGSADSAFKNPATNWDYSNIQKVDREADEIIEMIKTNLIDYPGSESQFKTSFSSDLLTTNTVYADFKGAKTWNELKAEYITDTKI